MNRKVFRKISAVLVTAAVLFTTVFSISVFANAATSFTPRLSAPDGSNKYYYNSNYNVFQRYGYGLPNCTAYAFGRAYEILGKEPNLSWNGASQWYDYNRSNGFYKYGKTPKVGAIACWTYGSGGHVAVVETIDSNGNMTLSNSEWGGRTFYLTYARTSDSNPGGNSWWTFQGYIYLIDSADVVIDDTSGYKTGNYQVNVSSYLNMRSGAGMGYSTVGSLYNNTKIAVTKTLYADGYNWGYTTYNNRTGWVALEYCSYLSPLTEPTTVAPTTVAPTTVAPTTVAPTTVAPTTVAPTTVAPTTVAPTTVAPTTVAPTTVAPTTVAPTTVAPTTVAPTTVAPTTVAPTTVAPTTVAPTTKPAKDLSHGIGYGDVNADGRITILDATMIQKYLVGSEMDFAPEQIKWCDFDFSGRVTIDDVTCLQRYLVTYF